MDPKKPIGIWLLAIPYVLYSGVYVYVLVNDRIRMCYWPCHRMPISESHAGLVLIAAFCLVLLGSIAVFVARQFGRVALLIGLVLVAGFYWYDTFELARAKARFKDFAPELTWGQLLQDPLFISLWVAFNFWYFMGRRTRGYFTAAHHE